MLWPLAIATVLTAGIGRPDQSSRLISLPIVWTTSTHTFLESAPTLADIDGDGFDETLLAAREELIAIDGQGRELWRQRTKGRYYTYPAALVRQGRPARVYATDGTGRMVCLDHRGGVVWQRDLASGASWCAPVLADLRGDGRWSVIQGTERGGVAALDAQTGEMIWTSPIDAAVVSPAVADVDRDGRCETVLCTSAGMATLLDSDGRARWTRQVSGPSPTWATSAPIIFAASDGKARICVGANEGRVTCLSADGATLWSRDTAGSVAASLSVGDIDRDGRADVFAVSQTGVIYRFDEAGAERWRIDMQGRTIAAGALVDMDGDGATEYAVCTQSGRLMAFGATGRLRAHHIFENRTINMTPTFGRVSACGGSLGLTVSGGESGKVFCLRTPASAASVAATQGWTAYRHDARKTGAWFGLRPAETASPLAGPTAGEAPKREGMAPLGDDWERICSGVPITFGIRVPDSTAQPLIATATCVRPDGSLQAAVSPVLGATGRLPLTVDVALPGVYRFDWSVLDAAGRLVCADAREMTLEPLASERTMLTRAAEALRSAAQKVASTLPLSASALRREATDLEQRWTTESATPGLVRRSQRAHSLAAAVESSLSLGAGASLVAFESGQWDGTDVEYAVPRSPVSPLQVRRRVVPGEHDAVAVKLLNITDRTLQVRMVADSRGPSPRVTLLHSVQAPASRGGMAWDPLPRLDESGIISIPSLECREMWVDSDFVNASPGRTRVRLIVQALNGSGVLEGPTGPRDVRAPETVAEIDYSVLPFAMAPAGSFRMCCWATYGPAEIRDLLAHGNNVFCVPQPEPRYDPTGKLAGFSTAKLDAMLTILRGHDIVALVQGMPSLRAQIGTPAYASALKEYLSFLKRHLARFGLAASRFALYPIDEPGGAGWNAVHLYAQFGRLVRKVAPNIRLYVNGGAELPMLREIGPCADIWCPGLSQLAEGTQEMQFIRATRKELWSYDCGYRYTTASRTTLKDTLIVPEYRTSALFATRHGASGIGFWCYNVGPNPWTRVENDYPMVYPGTSGPVTSRRWEAVREGVEDARILFGLRRALPKIGERVIRDRISRLLDIRLPSLVDRSHREVTMGLGRATFEASINEKTLNSFRTEMLDCVEVLTQRRSR